MTVVTKSLRTEVENEKKLHGYTDAQLKQVTGVSIEQLNYPRSITFDQLDGIAMFFGQARGWLYDVYLEECLADEERLALKRYQVGSHLFSQGMIQESIPFFRHIISNKSMVDEEQFAISHYRLFQALITVGGLEANKEAVFDLEKHYDRLPRGMQLDATLKLTNVFYTFEEWKKVEWYADELRTLANSIYQEFIKNLSITPIQAERPLVVYYGQGFLMKGIALTKQEQHEEAKMYFAECSNLGWFKFLNDDGKKEVDKFKAIASVNMLLLELETGNIDVLSALVEYLEEYPHRTLPVMLSAVQAANKRNLNIDELLLRFTESLNNLKTVDHYINSKQLFIYFCEKARYSLRKKEVSSHVDELLNALEIAKRMKYFSGFEMCVSAIKKTIDVLSEDQKERYKQLLGVKNE